MCSLYLELAFISDDDSDSVSSDGKSFASKLSLATLDFDNNLHFFSDVNLETGLNYKGRGAEMSELILMNNNLHSFCDKTGIMYKIVYGKLVPVHIFTEGRNSDKPMKIEWATRRKTNILLGSHGTNIDKQIVAVYSLIDNTIHYEDFSEIYEKMRTIAKVVATNGYIVFETVIYDNIKEEWFFIPRKISYQPYEETLDESVGCTKMFRCNIDFSQIDMIQIGKSDDLTDLDKASGYSSAKLVPVCNLNRDKIDGIFAIKTIEANGTFSSYYQIFDREGKIIKKLTLFSDKNKFEGVEVLERPTLHSNS